MLKAIAILVGWIDALVKSYRDSKLRAEGRTEESAARETAIKEDVVKAEAVRADVAAAVVSDPGSLREHDEFERP